MLDITKLFIYFILFVLTNHCNVILTEYVYTVGQEIRETQDTLEYQGKIYMLNDIVVSPGILVGFRAHVVRSTKVQFQLWRPTSVTTISSTQFRLIAKTEVTVKPSDLGQQKDYYVKDLDADRCARVQTGDHIGLYIEQKPCAVSNYFVPQSPRTLYGSFDSSKSLDIGTLIDFDPLPFPYQFNMQAYVLSGNGTQQQIPCPQEITLPPASVTTSPRRIVNTSVVSDIITVTIMGPNDSSVTTTGRNELDVSTFTITGEPSGINQTCAVVSPATNEDMDLADRRTAILVLLWLAALTILILLIVISLLILTIYLCREHKRRKVELKEHHIMPMFEAPGVTASPRIGYTNSNQPKQESTERNKGAHGNSEYDSIKMAQSDKVTPRIGRYADNKDDSASRFSLETTTSFLGNQPTASSTLTRATIPLPPEPQTPSPSGTLSPTSSAPINPAVSLLSVQSPGINSSRSLYPDVLATSIPEPPTNNLSEPTDLVSDSPEVSDISEAPMYSRVSKDNDVYQNDVTQNEPSSPEHHYADLPVTDAVGIDVIYVETD